MVHLIRKRISMVGEVNHHLPNERVSLCLEITMSSTPVRSAGVAMQREAMSRSDIKTLALASLGGALEYYDFIVAAFFTKLLAIPEPIPEPLLLGAYGALGGTGILTCAVLAEHFPARLLGRVNTTFTLVIFVGVFATQIGIGAALGHWTAVQGHYPAIAHQAVWAGLVIIQTAGAFWYFAPNRRKSVGAYAVESQ
jgi:hypothetical protein